MADVKANLNLNNPEVQVVIDRPLASDLGVRVADIAGAVRLLMSGEDQISTFKEGSEQYPVTMRLLPEQRDNPAALSRLMVPSARLGLIRLDSVAKLERGLGPSRIDRFQRQFAVGIYGNIAPGHSLNEGAQKTAAILDSISMPPGYTYAFSGQVKILEETTLNMILAFLLASIFMYMVLAAQFESLIHPFIILLTLPLSLPFALISLIVTGRSLNLFSALGVLLLLGIVKKNGILQIDYMNRLLAEGYPLRDAILEANRVRLRPILMTTFSIVAGLIPTAIGIGAGRFPALGHRGDDHRRADAVSSADVARGAGRLFTGRELPRGTRIGPRSAPFASRRLPPRAIEPANCNRYSRHASARRLLYSRQENNACRNQSGRYRRPSLLFSSRPPHRWTRFGPVRMSLFGRIAASTSRTRPTEGYTRALSIRTSWTRAGTWRFRVGRMQS